MVKWLQKTKKCNSKIKSYIGDIVYTRMTLWKIKSISNKRKVLQEYKGKVQRD